MSTFDIDAQFGHTPLHKAAWRCQKDEVRFLVICGERIEVRNAWGHTPLHRVASPRFDANASDELQIEVGRFLLRSGANVNARTRWDETPLHLAVQCGRIAMAKLLIESGADIHARTLYNWTPLHTAVDCLDQSAVELLLQNGADVHDAEAEIGGKDSIYSKYGAHKVTPLGLVLFKSQIEIVLTEEELRITKELEIDLETSRQRAEIKTQEMIDLLRRYGAVE